MKKMRLMPSIGLSAAVLAFVIMIVAAIIAGDFISREINPADSIKETSGGTQQPPENSSDVTDDSSSAVADEGTAAGSADIETNAATEGGNVSAGVTEDITDKEDPRMVLNYDNMKAMWISQFDMSSVYTNGSSQTPQRSFLNYVKTILDNVKACGINTVIIQMRPNADSMYPSEYYPMSKYVVGAYGKDATYDPMEIFIDEAHERGLSVQAWINPMRAMTVSEIKSVNGKYAIKKWYDANNGYTPVVSNGVYLDPGHEEVRQLIINGAREILERYPVDGLHMDDYFYPTGVTSAFDSASYTAYKKSGGKLSLEGFRKDSLNKLVAGLYSMTKSVSEDLIFGISPAGNINNVTDKQFADVYTWCKNEGYIDYICPQVYFGLEHQSYDFDKVSKTWQSIIKVDSIDLIIGMTLGKAVNGYDGKGDTYAGSGKNEWIRHKDILKRCLELSKSYEKCRGVSYFCYQYFFDPLSGVENNKTKTERDGFLPILKDISWK